MRGAPRADGGSDWGRDRVLGGLRAVKRGRTDGQKGISGPDSR